MPPKSKKSEEYQIGDSLQKISLVQRQSKYFYQIQFYCDTDIGYSLDGQTYSFIRWSLSEKQLHHLMQLISLQEKTIKNLVHEAILQRGLLDTEFWQKIYKVLSIDYETIYLSVLKDVRALVVLMCQSIINLCNIQRQKALQEKQI